MTSIDHDAQETRTAPPRELQRTTDDDAEPDGLLPGQTVGRFTVLSRVGQGGMGQVFAAYDPALDRRIALKVLRSEGSAVGRERLAREAKALARLSDPNVVTVYEVAEHEERLLIAMEYVDGHTLREWAKLHPADGDGRFGKALQLLIQAGRGLVAAHEAGLIHRDFKPSNVLVGHDGRVRVADFGLAQSKFAPRTSEAASGSQRTTDASPAESRLTAAGMAAGTPGYMAPEQLVAGPVDARADQYSFCVTAWQVLFGERPTDKGAASDGGYPDQASLRSTLRKGMRAQPRRRHKDMSALLDLIEPHVSDTRMPTPASTRRWLALSASTVAVLGAVLGGQWLWDARNRSNCTAAGDRVDEIWTAQARDQLRVGMTGDGSEYGSFALDKVLPRLDEYAESWRQDTTAACMNEHVHRTWDAEVGDRARWCLDDRLLRLSAFVETMAEADAQVIRGAIQAAAGLPATGECLDRAELPDQAPAPPAEMIPKLASLRSAVSRARALGAVGRYEDGLKVIRQARSEAAGVSWGPLQATTLLAQSGLQLGMGDYDAAQETGEAAHAAAVRADAWDIAAWAAIHQVFLVGDLQGKTEKGLLWAHVAELAMGRAGDPFGLVEASYAYSLSSLHIRAGNAGEAKRLAMLALERRRNALGEGHPAVADALRSVAYADDELREYALAEQGARQALKIYRETLGPNHPHVANALADLGQYYLHQGEIDRAKETILEALSNKRKTFGGDDLITAQIQGRLAAAYLRGGEPGRAVEIRRKALDITRKVLGEEHPDFTVAMYNLGLALTVSGDLVEAEPLLVRALAIGERSHGPDHVNQAWTAFILGSLYKDTQRPDQAVPLLQRSLQNFESRYGDDHQALAYPLDSLGKLALERGDIDDACALLERAVRVDHSPSPENTATTRFALARALWEKGDRPSRDRSLTLARNATSDLEDGSDQREINEWIAARDKSTAR